MIIFELSLSKAEKTNSDISSSLSNDSDRRSLYNRTNSVLFNLPSGLRMLNLVKMSVICCSERPFKKEIVCINLFRIYTYKSTSLVSEKLKIFS